MSTRGKLLNPGDIGYDVILLAGQSNEVGYGSPIDAVYYDVADPRVWQWPGSGSYMGNVIAAVDPLFHHEQKAASVGHGPTFGRRYAQFIPPNRRVLLVPCAHGGTGFTTSSAVSPPAGYVFNAGGSWDPADGSGGISLYDYAIAQTNAAIALSPTNRLVGIIWCQGEADGSRLTQSQYAPKLDALISGFRAGITGATNTPFLIQQMLPEYIAAGSGNIAGVNLAHIDTPRRNLRCAFSYGQTGYVYAGDGQNLHYNPPGQRLNGESLFGVLGLARANVLSIAPLVPSGLTFTQSGTSVTAQWVRPIGRATDYNVQYSTNGGASWTALTRSQSIDYTATITGLTLGAALLVQVRTVNEQGTSAWSASGSFTLATIPGQVTGLTAGSATSSSQPLTWTAVTGATSYLVEYKLHSSGTWLTSSTTATLAATVSGLATQTSYDYRATAINAAGSGTPSTTVTNSTTAAQPLMTDVGVSAFRAYSLRRVVSGFTKAISVRRSSDNTTQDVGFAAGTNDLDTTALLAFVGAGNGFIATWYDQSGHGYDITQATTTAQPQIVTAGVVNTANSKPSAVFSGAQVLFDSTLAHIGLAAGALTAMHVLSASTGAGFPVIWSESSTIAAHGSYNCFVTASSGVVGLSPTDDSGTSMGSGGAGPTVFAGTAEQFDFIDNAPAASWLLNGTASGSGTITHAGHTLTPQDFTVGATFNHSATASSFITASVSELVFWTSVLTTPQRQAGEINEKAYYATP